MKLAFHLEFSNLGNKLIALELGADVCWLLLGGIG